MKMAELMRSRGFAIAAAAVLALVVAGAATWFALAPAGRSMAGGEALVGGPFTLTDQHGAERTEHDFPGRYMLIYFGYTYCPDFCPMSLANMTRALDLLPPEQAEQVVPIFITVDPERDTPEVLKDYLSSFDDRIVGLTGDPASVEAAIRSFRGFARKVPGKDGDYTMEHTAFVYLMGRDGSFLGTVNMARAPVRCSPRTTTS